MPGCHYKQNCGTMEEGGLSKIARMSKVPRRTPESRIVSAASPRRIRRLSVCPLGAAALSLAAASALADEMQCDRRMSQAALPGAKNGAAGPLPVIVLAMTRSAVDVARALPAR